MAYIQHYDNRFGDYYEIYTDDVTGQFIHALRSVGGEVGTEKIYYANLSDLPPHHRNQIEQLIWSRLHPSRNETSK